MKRTIIIFGIILCALSVNAQTKRYFCEVKGEEKIFSAGLKIVFDFGDNPVYTVFGLRGKQKFVDENGKDIPFNSMVDACNYMTDRGWTLFQTYSSVYSETCNHHWVFYKDATTPEEATEGIMTKEQYQEQKKKK